MCSDTLSCGCSTGLGPPPAARSPGTALRSSTKCCFSLSPRARLTQKQPSHRQSSLRAPAIARSWRRVGSLRRAGTLQRHEGPTAERRVELQTSWSEGARSRDAAGAVQLRVPLLSGRNAGGQVGSSPAAARTSQAQNAAGAVSARALRESLSHSVCGQGVFRICL